MTTACSTNIFLAADFMFIFNTQYKFEKWSKLKYHHRKILINSNILNKHKNIEIESKFRENSIRRLGKSTREKQQHTTLGQNKLKTWEGAIKLLALFWTDLGCGGIVKLR